MDNLTNPPWLAFIPLQADHQAHTIVIVQHNHAVSPPEGLRQVLGFNADGQGAWISAAQAANGRWGYLDDHAQWRVPPTLDSTRNFSDDGFARFCQGGLWGFINLAGEVVIPPTFEEAHPFSDGFSAVKVGQHAWRIIDSQGRFTCEESFYALSTFGAEGLACAILWNKESNQRSQGFVNYRGTWVIKPRFRAARPFGKAPVTAASLDGETWGLIDLQGQWVLEPRYPRIEAFNNDGLAYYAEINSWDNGHGYLNTQGEVVFKGGRHLSKHMVCSIAANSYNGTSFIGADGKNLPIPRLSFSTNFRAKGSFAVARTADVQANESNTYQAGVWGLLHTNGRFLPVPLDLLEPLIDADGWIINPQPGTPFVPFLTANKQLAWVDSEGGVVWRADYDGKQVALLNVQGQTLWRSALLEACWPPQLFFNAPLSNHLQAIKALNDIVPLANTVLADAESRLHCLAAGNVLEPETRLEEEDEEDEENTEEEETDNAQSERTMFRRRVMRAYLSEEHNGSYEFMSLGLQATVNQAYQTLVKHLTTSFGSPDPDPEHVVPQNHHYEDLLAWPIPLAQPIAGDSGALRESSEQWLSIYKHSDSGDGDAWWEVWLMVAPSVDALQAAQRARNVSLQGVNNNKAHSVETFPQADSGEAKALPQTREQWLHAVRKHGNAIGDVPVAWLDDIMVDTALETDVEALEYVPAAWQTPERLATLIRRGAREAANIPPECMTSEGLALARSLYAGNREWDWRDERNSKLPTQWDHNALYGLWGCVLTPALALKAMRGGARLKDLPYWLRTDEVEKAALQADIYNISYIPKDKITPALAARAVRHDYGRLIAELPPAMLTPDLCLASVRANGSSLQDLPESFRSLEVCVAALKDCWDMFQFVPDTLRIAVTTRLIEDDLAQAREEGELRHASHWHSQRAWAKLWEKDYEGAIQDARHSLERVRHEQHPHYILASAHRALGQEHEAALEASTVLSMQSPYKAPWNDKEDTSWLQTLVGGKTNCADDAALIAQLQSHPRTLADIPRERITHAMVETALTSDEEAVRFVPRRLMTPARYALALRQNVKQFENIPPDMLSEEACIEYVRNSGWRLSNVPELWRTVQVCATALHCSPSVIEHVPDAIRTKVQEAVAQLSKDPQDEYGRPTAPPSAGLPNYLLKSMLRGNGSAAQRLYSKSLFIAFVLKTALFAKSEQSATRKGLAGWFEKRPMAAVVTNGLLALLALGCHLLVTIEATMTEGLWIGLATGVLMGVAEVYWIWRFLFSSTFSPWLAVAAIIVLIYLFGWRRMYRRLAQVFAARTQKNTK